MAETLVCRACGHLQEGEPGARCPQDGTLLVAQSAQRIYTFDELLGQTLGGRYDLVDVLGEGVMGQVFRGVSRVSGAQVAVKVIRRKSAPNEVSQARFKREAKLLGRLTHPNTVALLDWGEDPLSGPFLVQELVYGRTLRALSRERGALPPALALDIVAQVLDALEEAHQLGVVHRDVKPANVMVRDEGGRPVVKVLDFGLARVYDPAFGTAVFHTRAGAPVGTPRYAAPEALSGQKVGPTADLYGVAVMLYELLAGQAPFVGSVGAVIDGHLKRPPPPLPAEVDAPRRVRSALETALAKDPAARFQTATEMRHALRGTSPDDVAPTTLRRVASPRDQAPVEPPSRPPGPAVAPARYRAVVAVGLAAILGAVLAVYLQSFGVTRDVRPDAAAPPVLTAPAVSAPVAPDAGRVEAVPLDAAPPPVDWGRAPAIDAAPPPPAAAPPRRPRPTRPKRPRKPPEDAGQPKPDPAARIRAALARCECDVARARLRRAQLETQTRRTLQGELRRRCDMLGVGCNRGVGRDPPR